MRTVLLILPFLVVAMVSGCKPEQAQSPEGGTAAAPDRVSRFPWPKERMAEHPAVKELGLPLYPGAKPDSIDYWIQTRNGARAETQVILITPDSVEKVEAFYRGQLAPVKAFPPARPEPGGYTGVNLVFGEGTAKRVIHVFRGARQTETHIAAHWLKDCDDRSPEWEE